MARNIKELRRMYPKSNYILIRDRGVLKQFGRRREGNYVVAELSPSKGTRGRQPVLYWKVK